jgi:tellurite methyltransferase
MGPTTSARRFDEQFARQLREGDLRLNPFETAALPHLSGRVLDYGCGLGNLAVAAARRGCTVVALDASAEAVGHLRRVAAELALPIEAGQADLRTHVVRGEFDSIVAIGLLMYFDRPTAIAQLGQLQSHLRPGGHAVVNVLVEGTTWREMLDPSAHCLFERGELARHFRGWTTLLNEASEYPAAGDTIKSFETIVARKPGGRERPPAPDAGPQDRA